MNKTAILITNVGTPDSPKISDVRKYLFEFLNDRRVIDINVILQKILVNLIIVPFRAPKSAKLYKELWTEKGSPLLLYSQSLVEKLKKSIQDKDIYLAMRYGEPSIDSSLDEIKKRNYDKVIVFPLYPQYASSSTGTTYQKVLDIISKWEAIPEIELINQFYSHPKYIELMIKKIRSYNPESFDYVIFSYHGLPTRHVNKIHPKVKYENCNCSLKMPAHGKFCYRAVSYETTRLLANGLGLKQENYTTSFQSRLDNKWLEPFSDVVVEELAKEGKKRILIVAPSFVADCLETTIEIEDEYEEIFEENGGEKLVMVEALNAADEWVDCIKDIIEKK